MSRHHILCCGASHLYPQIMRAKAEQSFPHQRFLKTNKYWQMQMMVMVIVMVMVMVVVIVSSLYVSSLLLVNVSTSATIL